MEDLARKAEKEKLAELEAMLADATLSGDMADDSSGSFVSDVATPEHHQASPMAREDRATDPRSAWRPVYRGRWSDAGNDCFAVTGGRNLTEDVTAQAFSSSFNGTESSPRQRDTTRSRRNLNRKNKYEKSDHQPRAGQDAVVVELRSKLAATRAELERKEVISRSLQRQLHQREEIEAKNQAKAEEDLVAAVAKASGLKEELARTSQLLVDGAVARQQLEQRCAVLEEDLQKSAAKAKELEGEAFDARVEVMKVTGVLRSQRGDGVLAVERAYGKELQRMQECAEREAQALKHEASNQRTTLEEMRTQFTKACGERDAWREEAEAHASEAESLRETVSALRKSSENETIGDLLGQISRWKRRSEELEHLQQRSPVNPDPFDSISETSSSVDSASVSPRPFARSHDAEETSPGGRAEIPTVPPCKEGDERSDVALAAEAAQTTIEKLERDLSKAKEALSIAEEEAATARRENAEEKLKRTAAESRVKALEWGEIETENQAIAQKEQVAEAAKASGLKEELKRSTQLLMDGAVVRQQLEQRCSVLEQELKKSAARTTELEREVRNARAELVKVSKDLHSQRGTDVVEVERAYGDKLERIQETTKCEARALKHEARAQRDALKEMRIQFTKACGERDSWREEAQAHASEAKNLQETVNALRKYSEDEMIDALLGQISRWKQRAEELEHLQQRSPVNPDAFDSTLETISSVDSASVSPCSPGRSHDAGETIPGSLAEISTESPCKRGEDVKLDVGLAAQVTQAIVEKMGKELSEAKEALSIAEEETATARRENAEEKLKRTAAEIRVKALEIEAQANAEAARKSLSARREAKAKAFEQLKFTIRQEMVSELNRLRCEVEDQKQAERSQANAAIGQTCKCLSSNPQPLFLDKSCQISESSIYCGNCQKADPASTCCIGSGDSTVAETRIVVSAAEVMRTEEVDKRLEAAAAAAATAETLAASWARAFSSATAMIHSALATLRDLVNSVLGEKDDRNKTYMDLKVAGLNDPVVEESSIIAVPWVLPMVPMDVGTEGVLALEALRESVKSTAEGVRLALARSATRIAPAASAVETASLIVAATQTDDRGSQAPGGLDGIQCENRQRTIGVQAGLGEQRPVKMSRGCAAIINTSNSEAPAWERGGPAPGWVVPRQSGDFSSERRWREKDDAMVERLKRKAKTLGEELRRSQKEKDRLEQSLKQQEREKAIELKHQHALHQSQIQELHDSAMAIVYEFGTIITTAP